MFWVIIFIILGLLNIWVSLSSKADARIERRKQFVFGIGLIIAAIAVSLFIARN